MAKKAIDKFKAWVKESKWRTELGHENDERTKSVSVTTFPPQGGKIVAVFGAHNHKKPGSYLGSWFEVADGGGSVGPHNWTKFHEMVCKPQKDYGIVPEADKDAGIVVGQGATWHLFSDSEPMTIVEVINEKKIVARFDKSKLDPSWKPEIIPGGFAGHCTNNDSQKWIIEQDVHGACKTFTKRKNGQWIEVGSKTERGAVTLGIGYRRKKYDYNF